jgi:hypothetical protein
LRSFNAHVPPLLEEVIQQSLRKRPEHRPTATELASALTRSLGQTGLPAGIQKAPPPRPPTQMGGSVAGRPAQPAPHPQEARTELASSDAFRAPDPNNPKK